MDLSHVRTLLFDWGDTLMQDYALPGPMHEWAKVRVYEDVPETLSYLARKYTLGVATNASTSDAEAVRKALERGGIGRYIGPIFAMKEVGFMKPQPGFFDYAMKKLGQTESEICMVGDSFQNDVLGVVQLGIAAIWLNRGGPEIRRGHGYSTIHSFSDLKDLF